MNCTNFETDLKAYIDNELPGGRRAQIDRHIAACEQCRDEVTAMKTISKTIEQSENDEPISDGLRERILAQAALTPQERNTQRDSSQRRPFLTPSVARVWIGAIAASVIAAAMIVPVAIDRSPIGSHDREELQESMQTQEANHGALEQPSPIVSSRHQSSNEHFLAGRDVASGVSPQASPRVDLQAPTKEAPENSIDFSNVDNDKLYFEPIPLTHSGNYKNYDLGVTNRPAQAKITAGSTLATVNAAPPAGPPTTGTQIAQSTTAGSTNEIGGTTQQLFAQAVNGGFNTLPANSKLPGGYSLGDMNGTVTTNGAIGGTRNFKEQLQAAVPINNNLDMLDVQIVQRQVHREATLTVETADPESSSDTVASTVKSAGGFVAESNFTTDDAGTKSAQMTIKVPVAQFDTVLTSIEKLGNATSKDVTGEDITAKVSDASESESVLEEDADQSDTEIEKLGRHASWEDRENNRQLHIELAEARGRVETLGKLAELSNITLTLTQPAKAVPPIKTGMLNDLHGSGTVALQSMLSVIDFVLCAAIWVVAFIPVWGPLVFAGWYVRRRLHA